MHSGGAAICVNVPCGAVLVEFVVNRPVPAYVHVQAPKHSYVSPCRSHMQCVLESVGPW